MQFTVKKVSAQHAAKEVKNVGFDSGYLKEGVKKHEFLSLKVFGLTPQQATILKQAALSVGTDCAIHRHVIDFKVDKSDCVLSGSLRELEKLCEKLQGQPFSLKKLALEIQRQLEIQGKARETIIMGILNLTSNSFSDGGEFLNEVQALEHTDLMIKEGAKIIDIGAESTAPGSKGVGANEQIKLLIPVIKKIRKKYPEILISADTRSAEVAQEAVLAGADIINDVSFNKGVLDVAIEAGKKLVIMHSCGRTENSVEYKNVVDEIYFDLKEKCDFALSKGLKPENIIIDPGFGFAKNEAQNLELLSRIEEFKSLGFEILVGISRKRFLAPFSDSIPKNRDEITTVTSFFLAQNGIDIIRVHNVGANFKAVQLAQTLTS